MISTQSTIPLFEQGVEFMRQRQFAEAAAAFEQVVAEDAPPAEAVYNLGAARLALEYWEPAAQALLQYVKQAPDDPRGHLLLGISLRGLGLYEKALHALRRALRLDSRLARGWCELGWVCLLLGRVDDAKDGFKWAVRLHPHDAEALCGLAEVYEKKDLPGVALRLYQSALRHCPPENSSGIYLRVGRLYARVERWADARAALERAIKQGEAGEEVIFELGLAHLKCANREQALRQAEILVWMGSGLGKRLRQIIATVEVTI